METQYNLSTLAELAKNFSPEQTKKALRISLILASQELRERVVANSPVYKPQDPDVRPEYDRHDPGLFKGSWTEPEQIGDLLLSFRNPQPYASTLEEGTFPIEMVKAVRKDGTPGRLVIMEGGVFSRMTNSMAGGPVAKPVLTDAEFHERILKTIVKQLSLSIGVA